MLYWYKLRTKLPGISSYGMVAGAIILLAIVLRLMLIALGWPLLDSDEGTMGIMAMHIAYRGETPVFFYGQAYMGATEAYLGAIAFHLFGVSSFTLRLGLILIFAVFLLSMYLLTSLLYSKKLALLTLALLALGSNPMLVRELVAVGGDPETLMSCALLMLLTAWLALNSTPDGSMRNRWCRLLAYGAWGLVAGFTFFSHALGVPFIGLAGLILLLFCWRELFSLAPFILLIGLLVGIFPIIYYYLSVHSGKDTFFYIFHAMSAGNATFHLRQQLLGALLISVPTATGAGPLCSVSDAYALNLDSWHGAHCVLVHAGWSVGLLALGILAFVMICMNLYRLLLVRTQRTWEANERQRYIRNILRLSLLTGAVTALGFYILSPNAMLYPVATSRYLIGMLIATPVILWPLWRGVYIVKPLALKLFRSGTVALRLERASSFLRYGLLALIIAVFFLGTFSTFTGIPAQPANVFRDDVYFTQNSTQHLDVPATQALNQQEHMLIEKLLQMHVVHIYADYWTCDRLIFQSQEQILCSVINDQLGTGHNRYHPYYTIVNADPHAVYVVRVGSTQDTQFIHNIAAAVSPWKRYKRQIFAGYALYQKAT